MASQLTEVFTLTTAKQHPFFCAASKKSLNKDYFLNERSLPNTAYETDRGHVMTGETAPR